MSARYARARDCVSVMRSRDPVSANVVERQQSESFDYSNHRLIIRTLQRPHFIMNSYY